MGEVDCEGKVARGVGATFPLANVFLQQPAGLHSMAGHQPLGCGRLSYRPEGPAAPDPGVRAAQPNSGPWLLEEQPRGQWRLLASAPLAFLAILKAPKPHVLHLPTSHLLKIPGGAPFFPHLSLTGTLRFCHPGRLHSWIPSISGQRSRGV